MRNEVRAKLSPPPLIVWRRSPGPSEDHRKIRETAPPGKGPLTDGVEVHDLHVPEAAQGQVLEELAADAAGPDEEYPRGEDRG